MKTIAQTRIEPLEPRIAPATLTGKVLTYNDVDGDRVTVKITKGTFAESNFTFDTAFNSAGPQQLRLLDLQSLTGFARTTISITARPTANGGDGRVNVGFIDGSDVDLGAVRIAGDLGKIAAGDATTATVGLGSLTVQSLGRFGTSTGAPDLGSLVIGAVGNLQIKGDVVAAAFGAGAIGKVSVGGSLLGAAAGTGRISCLGAMGPVKIGGDLVGGAGGDSGKISATGIARVTVGGSVIGGAGSNSGAIVSASRIGPVKIGSNLIGDGLNSGLIFANTTLAGALVGGSVIGGAMNESGQIASLLAMGPVNVRGDLNGGAGENSGAIQSTATIAAVKIGGSVTGDGFQSGSVVATGKLAGVTIGGSLVGGPAISSGLIRGGGVGPVKIDGNLEGGTFAGMAPFNFGCGAVISFGKLASVTVGGSLIGGANNAGRILSTDHLGFVTIKGSLLGGTGSDSGQVATNGADIGGVTIGGSVEGGAGFQSGLIEALGGDLGFAKIAVDLKGGSNAFAGSVVAGDRIGLVQIGGSVTSGSATFTGSIRAGGQLGTVAVKGSLVGDVSDLVLVTATTGINKLTVGGRVEFTQIRAGYTTGGVAQTADAQIGPVTIGGDWIASSIAAGVLANAEGGFGTPDDALIPLNDNPAVASRIASILIKGQALGTPATAGDHFGFVAEQIGSLKIGTASFGFTSAEDEVRSIGATNDLTAREDV